ncbi:ImmA/IrrE family metallo-endopeptidase [Rhodococcus spelaei]|uniref:ImmA/IrrE family metallo-endopeptidase n=1 Tax=Rhodococcus spelaei TaxID=2546320 RepID=A0A541BNZ9_9NOCA|nr:short-chain fatty acyl-CoA regulator family protein [Rhodococcus spelaei]TQF74074.1 ImmA/IrrE family metallo-endopeptidase [Rhodococcus spelaei]
MRKMYAGARLRRLREERGLTQLALAKRLGLSPSYLNQLENDQRPLTVPVLMKLNAAFDLDVQFFATDEDARLVADLHEVLTETAEAGEATPGEVEELVARMPAIGRTLVALHRRLHSANDQIEQFSAQLSGGEPTGAEYAPMPYEAVRDFFYDRRNHIPELDEAAEEMFTGSGLSVGALDLQLAELLRSDFGVTVQIRADETGTGDGVAFGPKRAFDARGRTLTIARRLTPGQRAFQMATQLAFLAHATLLDSLVAEDDSLNAESAALARIGLANYFAGALILPYTRFLRAAESLRYDIDLLGIEFEVGFETICHRLSTLQRKGHRGVPFFFVRTDRAGNISKRQSATAFHFSRVGGSCPLWVVHEAFVNPGRVLTQVAQMPDSRTYLWIARTTHSGGIGYLAPEQNFAIGLGCDIGYAHKLVYSHGLQVDDPATPVPIGAGCKVCDRPACAQRAFPQLGRPIRVDEDRSSNLPYPHS